jgi:class 3 adenylate cyclase/predicted ATPase
MSEYAQRFAENDIDASVLPHLTDQSLRELGISLGHRLKMLAAIKELGGPAPGPPQLATPTETKPHDAGERRQVTVMFSDLVGSTVLSARMDPEDLREVISAYQKAVAQTVQRLGGFLAKYMGDGVLVYFGYPQAHEDDAERAVRAGLELIAAVKALKAASPLQTRVGIATGLVVVGDLIGSGAAQEQAVVGETPNVASRLQSIAEPNTVVIAESTRKLLGNLFDLQDLGAQELKGIDVPVRAWAVLRSSLVESRFEALHASGLTELVGREEELELLLRRWSKAKNGEGQVVLISGEAGIGKSRLTAALLENLTCEPHVRLRYFCSPQHTDSALYPIISQMDRAAGLAHGDTSQVKLDKLDVLLAQTSTSKQDAALFAEMLSLPNDGRYPALDLEPQQRRQKTLEALTAQMEALSRQNPLLMIFEDAHWTDPTSLETFGRVVDRVRSLPVLLIVTFRPEFEPPWIGRAYVTALTLNRLAQRDIEAIIDGVVGNKLIPASVRHDIIERTDGIPLFVEEMTKTVLEAGNEGAAEHAAAFALSPALGVPATLQASLMSRLDRLGLAKEVAQIGAAIGREFSHTLLATVVLKPEAELNSALDRLISAGLLFRQGMPPHVNYLFKHALVQDAAYGTLLREPRRSLHARIAETVETQFPEVAEGQPELLARHCTQAGLIEQAVGYWSKAGRKSVSRSAMTEAVIQLRNGLQLLATLPGNPARDRQELDLQSALGGALVASKGIAASETGQAYARARTLCEQLGDNVALVPVLSGQISHHFGRAEYATARRTAEDLLRIAQKQQDTAGQLVGSRSMGLCLHLLGDFAAAVENFKRVLFLYDPEVHRALATVAAYDMRALALTYLSFDLFILGYPEQAAARSEEALAWSRDLNHPHSLAYALSFTTMLHINRRAHQQAETTIGEVFSLAEQQHLSVWFASAHVLRGYLLAVRGEPTKGLALARKGIAEKNAQGSVLNQPFFLALLARCCELANQADEAFDLLGEALEIADRTGERWYEAELHRHRGDWLLVHRDAQQAEAEACFNRALLTAQNQRARMWELRAGVRLARIWRDQKKTSEAHKLLASVQCTEGRDTPDPKEARLLLEELRSSQSR